MPPKTGPGSALKVKFRKLMTPAAVPPYRGGGCSPSHPGPSPTGPTNAPPVESEYRLSHRHPAGHARGIWGEGAAVRDSVNPHQLAAEPQTLGREEMPLEAAGVLV